MDPQPQHPLRHVVLDDPTERLSPGQALQLVAVETLGLAVLFSVFFVLEGQDSELALLMIPPVVTLATLVAMPRAASSRPLRILASYAIAGTTGLLVTALFGHSVVLTILIGAITLFLMHITGTMHPPAVAIALVASRSTLVGEEAALALPFVLGIVVVVLLGAWMGHRVLGDREYPRQWG